MGRIFDCRCECRLGGDDPAAVHAAACEFMRLRDEHPDVIDASFWRLNWREVILLAIAAPDDGTACRLAAGIVGEIEQTLTCRFGADVLRPGLIAVQPASPTPVPAMAQIRELLAPVGAGRRADARPQEPASREPLDEPYAALHAAGTRSASCDLETNDIIARLQAWEEYVPLHIVDVGPGHVTITFDRLPDDVETFVAEAIEFCPDLCDEDLAGNLDLDDLEEPGVELVQAAIDYVADALRRDRALQLWWD
jgi:hypothetical protein